MTLSELAKEQLLNWDHDINPTPLKDIEFNIAHYMMCNGHTAAVMLTEDNIEIRTVKSATFGKGASFGVACEPHWSIELFADWNGVIPKDRYGRTYQALPCNVYQLAELVKNVH